MPFEVWYCNECGEIVSYAEVDPVEGDLPPLSAPTSRLLEAPLVTMTVYPCGHLRDASRERPAPA
jgi:hypothetical protein